MICGGSPQGVRPLANKDKLANITSQGYVWKHSIYVLNVWSRLFFLEAVEIRSVDPISEESYFIRDGNGGRAWQLRLCHAVTEVINKYTCRVLERAGWILLLRSGLALMARI